MVSDPAVLFRPTAVLVLVLAGANAIVACTTPSTRPAVDDTSLGGGEAATDSALAAPTVPPELPTPAPLPTKVSTEGVSGLANPASTFCVESGGAVEIRSQADGAQYGVCVFDDGTECEEWDYFRGDCARGETDSADHPAGNDPYVNDHYGFVFVPAANWTAEPDANHVVFRHGDYFLFVGFIHEGEIVPPFRTGMPAGEFVSGNSATLLGQELPTRRLMLDDRTKVVEYAPGVVAGEMQLFTWLDAEGEATDYMEVDIPDEIMEEANQIVASFAFTSGEKPALELPAPTAP